MSPEENEPEKAPGLIWERPEPAARSTPQPLSREGIVRAAVTIADAEGLVSVSLRKVGAALNAGPMRLYGYLSTKEELLDLMVDAIYAEMALSEPVAGDWRDALRTVARRTRQASLAHPWFVDLLGGRPHQGPNALAYLEASLAALAETPGIDSVDTLMLILKTVNAYTIGAVRSEVGEARAERDSGLDKIAWQNANGPYIMRMIATGRFPTLARVVRDATHPPAEVVFEQGLEIVLDGIAAWLAASATKQSP